MTQVTRESLQRRYADLVDAELLRRLHSGVLTELAQEVATAEARARGLSLDEPAPSPGPVVPDTFDFAPDEFEHNPYQAPRAPAQAPAASERPSTSSGILDVLWYLYVAVFVLLVATATIFGPNPFDAISLIESITTGFTVTGIVAWRLRRAWLHPVVWVTGLAVTLAWLAAKIRHAWAILEAAGTVSDLLSLFLIGVAMTTALHLPLFWGIARYALFSPALWRPRRPHATTGSA